jgi:hypothetical protein
MTVIVEEQPTYPGEIPPSNYLAWTPAVAGALIATAFSTTLIAFGIALGLGVASTAPTWRDASVALLSGIYLILVALISFGLGGYAAGRIQANADATDTADIEHRYGVHGLAAWAMAVVLTVLISALVGGATLSRTPSASVYAAPTTSAAEPLLSYELDRLFRPARRNPNTETTQERAEAGRILLTSSSHSSVAAEDRTYLVQLVSGVTALTGPDAERRVDSAVANARTAIARSRRSAVIAAFSIAASILLGAVVAWFAAGEGGRNRDRGPLDQFVEGGLGRR